VTDWLTSPCQAWRRWGGGRGKKEEGKIACPPKRMFQGRQWKPRSADVQPLTGLRSFPIITSNQFICPERRFVNHHPWENWHNRNLAFSPPSAGLGEEQVSSFEDVTNPPLCQGFARRSEESHGWQWSWCLRVPSVENAPPI